MAELKKINDTTFSADDLGDVKPKVKIGGKDEKKFIPNLNASFFDDEFYFNLNRKEKPGVLTAIEAKITGDDTDEWYIDKDGRLKWDVVFDSCPENLTLEWELKYKSGIEFIYQGELTGEEIKDGCVRPDEVIGSYAVYCNKANNKYKTGKLTHIYRPFVIDADGARDWATLLIENGKLTITLPEEFMSSAKYPVRLDPTFGYTTSGGSYGTVYGGFNRGSIYGTRTAAPGDTITNYSVYLRHMGSATTADIAAYTVVSGELDSRLAAAATVSVSSGDMTLITSSAVSHALSAGSVYGLAFGNTGNTVQVAYDDGTGYCDIPGSEGALPATWDHSSFIDRILSLYATYTEGGGTTILPQIVHHMKQQGIMS